MRSKTRFISSSLSFRSVMRVATARREFQGSPSTLLFFNLAFEIPRIVKRSRNRYWREMLRAFCRVWNVCTGWPGGMRSIVRHENVSVESSVTYSFGGKSFLLQDKQTFYGYCKIHLVHFIMGFQCQLLPDNLPSPWTDVIRSTSWRTSHPSNDVSDSDAAGKDVAPRSISMIL